MVALEAAAALGPHPELQDLVLDDGLEGVDPGADLDRGGGGVLARGHARVRVIGAAGAARAARGQAERNDRGYRRAMIACLQGRGYTVR